MGDRHSVSGKYFMSKNGRNLSLIQRMSDCQVSRQSAVVTQNTDCPTEQDPKSSRASTHEDRRKGEPGLGRVRSRSRVQDQFEMTLRHDLRAIQKRAVES